MSEENYTWIRIINSLKWSVLITAAIFILLNGVVFGYVGKKILFEGAQLACNFDHFVSTGGFCALRSPGAMVKVSRLLVMA